MGWGMGTQESRNWGEGETMPGDTGQFLWQKRCPYCPGAQSIRAGVLEEMPPREDLNSDRIAGGGSTPGSHESRSLASLQTQVALC